MTNFGAIGLAQFHRDAMDQYFERRFQPIAPAPRHAPRTAMLREPELMIEARRYHEVGHLMGAHCYDMTVEELCAVSRTLRLARS